MKTALVLVAGVCLIVSVSSASIFSCWLTSDWAPGMAVGDEITVGIWGTVLPDPAIPGEMIDHAGMHDMAITVYTPDTVGLARPVESDNFCVYGASFNAWGLRLAPAVIDDGHDGDMDDVQMCLGTVGKNATGSAGTIGVGGPVLLATEAWTLTGMNSATLAVRAQPTSRHFVNGTTTGEAEVYSGFEASGVQVGAGVVAPPSGLTLIPTLEKVNTVRRLGPYADVSLTVGGSDAATGGVLAFGDGTTQTFNSLPFTITHSYTLGSGDSETFTASATAGDTTATATVQVVQAPDVAVLINGQEPDGEAVFATGPVTIDLSHSTGYIQDYWYADAWTLDFQSTADVLTLDPAQYPHGAVFKVSNNGVGQSSDGALLNSSTMIVTFIPEPATLSLLAAGALALLRRRK